LKTKIFIAFALTCSTLSYSQQLQWAQNLETPKERNLYTALSFPGVANNIYFVNEATGGGITFSRKYTNYIKYIDINNLKVQKDQYLNSVANNLSGKDEDYLNASNFLFKSKLYSFFIDRNDKSIFKVYGAIQNLDGTIVQNAKDIFTMNLSNCDLKGSKFYRSILGALNVRIAPTKDGQTILSAYISDVIDKNYGKLTITEWSEDLKIISSNTYKVPYKMFQPTTKTIFGDLSEGDLIPPKIHSIGKDNNGFSYIILESDNPEGKADGGRFWIVQTKNTDPSYFKLYKNELGKNVAPTEVRLFQSSQGQVFVASIGKEVENSDDRSNRYQVNSESILRFDANGKIEVLVSKRIPNEMMYFFEKEKKVNKDGYINSLSIKDVLATSEGGFYVIWQHEWLEFKQHSNDFHFDNLLIQYFNSQNKMVWEKPIYKKQTQSDKIELGYVGIRDFLINDELVIIFPDDSKNAIKPTNDKEVEEFVALKFGNKDLAGLSIATFTKDGTYTKKYINWSEERGGFASI
jgi:hypothetical protein